MRSFHGSLANMATPPLLASQTAWVLTALLLAFCGLQGLPCWIWHFFSLRRVAIACGASFVSWRAVMSASHVEMASALGLREWISADMIERVSLLAFCIFAFVWLWLGLPLWPRLALLFCFSLPSSWGTFLHRTSCHKPDGQTCCRFLSLGKRLCCRCLRCSTPPYLRYKYWFSPPLLASS